MRPVDAAWSRVEQWLETRAPLVRDALRPAATQAEIDGASARLGAELPDDLASLLRLHDGAEDTDAGRFLSGMRLLPLREIESAHRGMCSMLTGDDLVGIWWHAQWIPFAANHDGWSRLYLDVRPGPGSGAVGSFFMESGGERRWPSLTVYLEQVAASLEDGAPLNHRTPRVAGVRARRLGLASAAPATAVDQAAPARRVNGRRGCAGCRPAHPHAVRIRPG